MAGSRCGAAVVACAIAFLLAGCSGGGQPDVIDGDDVIVGTECLSSSQCDDDIPCTLDLCSRGFCSNEPMQCDDDDDCTTDSCVDGACHYLRIPNCCETDADCDDGDPCTKNDRCGASKRCTIADPMSPCCRSDDDCDDGDVCTEDVCQTNLLCGHLWKVQKTVCCVDSNGCTDGESCTRDKCVLYDGSHGRCDFERICCDTAADCTDGESTCMRGVCEVPVGGSGLECSYEWVDDCCLKVDDCPQYDCQVASCAGNECSWDRIPGCCTSDLDCPHPKDCLQCNNGEAATGVCVLKGIDGCCDIEVYRERFDAIGEWGIQTPSQYMMDSSGYSDDAAWSVSADESASASTSLGFADPITGSCRVKDMKSGGRAVSPSIPLMMTNDPVLTFQMWKYTDDISSTKDVVSVYVKSSTGVLTQVFTTKSLAHFITGETAAGAVFEFFPTTGSIDLSDWAEQNIQLVFEYDSVASGLVEDYGVFIDDIVVSGTCN